MRRWALGILCVLSAASPAAAHPAPFSYVDLHLDAKVAQLEVFGTNSDDDLVVELPFAAMLIALPFMGDVLQGHMTRLAARIMGG